MKIKLAVSDARYDEVKEYLEQKGIEVDDSAEFTLTETGKYASVISARNTLTNEKHHIAVRDVIYLESFGHSVEIHTADETYQSAEPLYRLSEALDPTKFLRVSNSVVVAVNKITKIKPALSMKFILTMANGELVDVTRSYYDTFKKFIGI